MNKVRRKIYKAPELSEFEMDRSMLLVMASPNDGTGPTDPGGGGGPPQPTAQQSTPFEETSLDENNFK